MENGTFNCQKCSYDIYKSVNERHFGKNTNKWFLFNTLNLVAIVPGRTIGPETRYVNNNNKKRLFTTLHDINSTYLNSGDKGSLVKADNHETPCSTTNDIPTCAKIGHICTHILLNLVMMNQFQLLTLTLKQLGRITKGKYRLH